MGVNTAAEAGFELQADASTRLVQGRGWGFWDRALAERFQRQLLDTMRRLGRPTRLLLDVTDLLPQPDDTQESLRQLMAASAPAGLAQAVLISTNAITRLQLTRLAREARAPHWVLVADLAQAQRRLTP